MATEISSTDDGTTQAHAASLVEPAEHTRLRRAERQLGSGCLVRAVVYVDQVEQDGLDLG